MRRLRPTLLLLAAAPLAAGASVHPPVIDPAPFARHVAWFNALEPNPGDGAVPDPQAWDWLRGRVPAFECADAEVEEIYWYRWWAKRKHLRLDPASGHLVFTEFINRPKPVSSALGHQLYEGRWLRDRAPHDETLRYWLRGHEGGPQPHLRRYSSWLADACWQRHLVTGDRAFLADLFDDLVRDHEAWRSSHRREDGLYWQHDVWDAMEESISGSRTRRNVRPTINSYMAANARALAAMAAELGRAEQAAGFAAEAEQLRALTLATLWDPEAVFFKVRDESGPFADVREAIGFIPWYFGLPPAGAPAGYERAWAQLRDPRGFAAPFGITTAERRHPRFRSHGIGTCEWDGAVWPFATSQTLVALGRVLRDGPPPPADVIDAWDHHRAFLAYVRAHRAEDGKPYIGEYLDEVTGQWLKGRDPRSRHYLHSTFADVLITGVIGLRPRPDAVIEIHPLLPPQAWAWFGIDGVPYRGRTLTILWDRDGSRYGRGAGLILLIDGREAARAPTLQRLTAPLD